MVEVRVKVDFAELSGKVEAFCESLSVLLSDCGHMGWDVVVEVRHSE